MGRHSLTSFSSLASDLGTDRGDEESVLEQESPESHVKRTSPAPAPHPGRLRVVDESADWLVVDKPPFLEVHPSKPDGRVTLWDELRELLSFEIVNGGQVSIINRLDRETSGLTLIAKSRDAARTFHQLMQQRKIAKDYLALVHGWPVEESFEVDAPILRQGTRQPSRIHLKQMVHADGAPALTRFRVEQRIDSTAGLLSLLRAFPVTGRMHQIRVHLAHAGHAVLGDKIYGSDESCYLDFIAAGWTPELEARLVLPRHALHSAALRVPDLGLTWESPLPDDLASWAAAAAMPSRDSPAA